MRTRNSASGASSSSTGSSRSSSTTIRNGAVFGARDPFGVVPLYFVSDGGTLYVASTIGALTFLDRPIRAVPPGSYARPAGECQGHMRDPSREPPTRTSGDVVERVKEALGAAVAKRVDTDLPIAVLYSGGIDSSIVLHEATRRHRDVTAFTIGTPDSEDLEISRRFCEERDIRRSSSRSPAGTSRRDNPADDQGDRTGGVRSTSSTPSSRMPVFRADPRAGHQGRPRAATAATSSSAATRCISACRSRTRRSCSGTSSCRCIERSCNAWTGAAWRSRSRLASHSSTPTW